MLKVTLPSWVVAVSKYRIPFTVESAELSQYNLTGQQTVPFCTARVSKYKSGAPNGTRGAESDFSLQNWIGILGLKQIFLIFCVWNFDFRGKLQNSFIRGASPPRSNTLPFYIPFLTEKCTPFEYLLLRNGTKYTSFTTTLEHACLLTDKKITKPGNFLVSFTSVCSF